MKKIDFTNQKFNRLLALEEFITNKKGRYWKCQCDCGNIKIIEQHELKSGGTKSCGCLNNEKRSERAAKMYLTKTYYHPSETSARRIWKKGYSDDKLAFEDFYKLSQMNCHYCGSPPNNKCNAAKEDKKSSQYAKDNGDFIYNGLDRIDNKISHSLNNLVPCCKWCNYAKRERSVEEFLEWVGRVWEKSL